MPKQKDLKRLVRARMEKTGESYTAARARLIRKKTPASTPTASTSRAVSVPPSETARKSRSASAPASARATSPTPHGSAVPVSRPPEVSDLGKTAGMSDESVRARTGKDWAEWVKTLDAIDAARMSHRDIAAYVHEVQGVDGWWAQTVTVGYERIKGLRERGQRRDGFYECNKSRTFAVPVEALYRAFSSAAVRRKWLGDVGLTVRKATPHKSVRIVWPDGTRVEVGLTDKGAKSQAAIQHTKLSSKEEAARLKAWWGERLDRLAEVLRA